ncbi:unnamed protein product [Cylicostephanus goldi]|uniref:Uncharacterized protein n=1 Tax=Cylicostephanus goldi TaxID=71465 RepID=A0A3P7MVL2_CYLGO|nr:unnamed protein product [Cylicostephanus goldi]
MKELYSDFIVQEILEDETVLRLATASEVRSYVKEEEEKGVDEAVDVPSSLSAEQVTALDALDKNSKPYLIPVEGLSKEDRKAIHDFVRMRYQGKLGSETSEKGIEISYCGVNSRTSLV